MSSTRTHIQFVRFVSRVIFKYHNRPDSNEFETERHQPNTQIEIHII